MNDNALDFLKEQWRSDLELVLSPRAAEIYAHHLVEDLANRFVIRPKATPKPRKSKR